MSQIPPAKVGVRGECRKGKSCCLKLRLSAVSVCLALVYIRLNDKTASEKAVSDMIFLSFFPLKKTIRKRDMGKNLTKESWRG